MRPLSVVKWRCVRSDDVASSTPHRDRTEKAGFHNYIFSLSLFPFRRANAYFIPELFFPHRRVGALYVIASFLEVTQMSAGLTSTAPSADWDLSETIVVAAAIVFL
ncbi:hypothetical protein NPIL_55671 [Nephila pilipes]|uniref:Uncharacterized protein n=1 Tax=Nephila pilipes TaxID=299642 RepID=A0A8X6QN10_NEPPI|nr:hypothetical protein NPIL_55671 [Nephila pilipes]